MTIIIPAYITNNKNIDIIIDQLYVTFESYYQHGNMGDFLIFTNSKLIVKAIQKYNKVFNRDVKVDVIDFKKEWEKTGLEINSVRSRRDFIISKLIIPFIYEGSYLLMDWDILTTGYIKPQYIESDRMRFFNPKFFDGSTLRQIGVWKGIKPENETLGRNHWVNSGFAYFPKDLQKQMLLEYWDKFDSVREQQYRGIYLFDIIGDEMIYNLMLIDNLRCVEECTSYNLNVCLKNLYYKFHGIDSLYSFGKEHPGILNIHFSVGYVKPFNVIINEKGDLSFTIVMERYNMEFHDVEWTFSMDKHRMGTHHYNALMFAIVWQFTRYQIREKMGLEKKLISPRYYDFFERCYINYGK